MQIFRGLWQGWLERSSLSAFGLSPPRMAKSPSNSMGRSTMRIGSLMSGNGHPYYNYNPCSCYLPAY